MWRGAVLPGRACTSSAAHPMIAGWACAAEAAPRTCCPLLPLRWPRSRVSQLASWRRRRPLMPARLHRPVPLWQATPHGALLPSAAAQPQRSQGGRNKAEGRRMPPPGRQRAASSCPIAMAGLPAAIARTHDRRRCLWRACGFARAPPPATNRRRARQHGQPPGCTAGGSTSHRLRRPLGPLLNPSPPLHAIPAAECLPRRRKSPRSGPSWAASGPT